MLCFHQIFILFIRREEKKWNENITKYIRNSNEITDQIGRQCAGLQPIAHRFRYSSVDYVTEDIGVLPDDGQHLREIIDGTDLPQVRHHCYVLKLWWHQLGIGWHLPRFVQFKTSLGEEWTERIHTRGYIFAVIIPRPELKVFRSGPGGDRLTRRPDQHRNISGHRWEREWVDYQCLWNKFKVLTHHWVNTNLFLSSFTHYW